MKKGEVWREREDGTKIKIYNIKYSLDRRDYLVYYESVEKDWNYKLDRKDFLKFHEFCE